MDEIVITTGALEALTLSLQALTRPGDIVAIERPAFHAALEAVQRLHLKAVEIPVDPRTGLDLDALEKALDTHPVRACWFMTSFHNPTGATLTDERKRALIDLLAARNVPLIEDDVYGELHFGTSPTRPAKLYDDSGLVLHCGSFSKCLAPGFRIGWVAAGRYVRQIRQARAQRAGGRRACADGDFELPARRRVRPLPAQAAPQSRRAPGADARGRARVFSGRH